MRSRQVPGILEGIYDGEQYMGEGGGSRTCKETNRWVQRKIKCGSKAIGRSRTENKTESGGRRI